MITYDEMIKGLENSTDIDLTIKYFREINSHIDSNVYLKYLELGGSEKFVQTSLLTTDSKILKQAIRNKPSLIKKIPDYYLTAEMSTIAVEKDPELFKHVYEFNREEKAIRIALEHDPYNAEYLKSYEIPEDLYETMVKKTPSSIRFIPKEKRTEDMAVYAVNEDSNSAKWLSKEMMDKISNRIIKRDKEYFLYVSAIWEKSNPGTILKNKIIIDPDTGSSISSKNKVSEVSETNLELN